MLRRRDAPGDRTRATDLDALALAAAVELGMPALEARIHGAASSSSAPSAGAAVFRREGEYWTIAFEGDAFRLKDSKGLSYLARLLQRPGQELHAVDLASPDGGGATSSVALEDLRIQTDDGAGALLDDTAKAAYRGRIDELRSEMAQAEEWNDGERAARARAELDALTSELAAAVGLGGRDRQAGSTAERARVSVTRAIRAALDRVTAESPALGRHLDATVHIGTYCSYTPDPRVPIAWER